jgi:hypothetical protein
MVEFLHRGTAAICAFRPVGVGGKRSFKEDFLLGAQRSREFELSQANNRQLLGPACPAARQGA